MLEFDKFATIGKCIQIQELHKFTFMILCIGINMRMIRKGQVEEIQYVPF